jgi:CRISPR-associated endonuclease Csy4
MLINALFAKLHRALVALQSREIGVSFPKVDKKRPHLGDILRLHGSEAALENLQKKNWLSGMRDHVEVGEITPVPPDSSHCRIRRVQAKSSAERMRRRYRKRHEDVTERDVEGLIPDSVEKRLDLPYLQLKSESTGQRFRLFLEHMPPKSHSSSGEFNTYGLSNEATIPWF